MDQGPVVKSIGGIAFSDPFAWLQENSVEAVRWQWARSEEAKAAVPRSCFDDLQARMLTLTRGAGGTMAPRKRGMHWFTFGSEDGVASLLVSDEIDAKPKVVIDAETLSKRWDGAQVSLTWFEPSPDGEYVAVAYCVNGDMHGIWAVAETSTGTLLSETKGHAYTGARPGWTADGSGFYLDGRSSSGDHVLQFVPVAPETSQRPSVRVPAAIVSPKHAGLTVQLSPDGDHGIVVSEPHEHVALALLDVDTGALKRFLPADFHGECDGSWDGNDHYIARVTGDTARGRVVRIPVATSQNTDTWTELVAESEGFLAWAGVVSGLLYVGDHVDVSLRVRVFSLEGDLLQILPLDDLGASPSMFLDRAIRPTDCLTFTHSTFVRSPRLLLHDAETMTLRTVTEASFDFADVKVERYFAKSVDGVSIPYFVVARSNLDRSQPQPALFYGYGGFNIALLPNFLTSHMPFIEAGGIYVHCCLRGGAEYGRPWYDAGRLKNKWNTFHDLFAIADQLIANGTTDPRTTIIHGGSNGGLLAGAAAVHRPDLWRVAIAQVPIFDLMEPIPNTPETAGVRAIFYEDYGDPSNPEDAASIVTWSPYHNIVPNTRYPAVFQVFGECDLSCQPFQGRKFTARLREATTSSHPIHLRIWPNVGHGSSDPQVATAQVS